MAAQRWRIGQGAELRSEAPSQAGTDVCKQKQKKRRKPPVFRDSKWRVQSEICSTTEATDPLPARPRPSPRLKATEITGKHLAQQGLTAKMVRPEVTGWCCGKTALTRRMRLRHAFIALKLKVLTDGRPNGEALLEPSIQIEHTVHCQPRGTALRAWSFCADPQTSILPP